MPQTPFKSKPLLDFIIGGGICMGPGREDTTVHIASEDTIYRSAWTSTRLDVIQVDVWASCKRRASLWLA